MQEKFSGELGLRGFPGGAGAPGQDKIVYAFFPANVRESCRVLLLAPRGKIDYNKNERAK